MATDRITKQVIKYISDMQKKAKQMRFVKELKKEVEIGLFPIGEPDLSAYDFSEDLKTYIEDAINKRFDFLAKDIPVFKLWHLNGSENRKNKDKYEVLVLNLYLVETHTFSGDY